MSGKYSGSTRRSAAAFSYGPYRTQSWSISIQNGLCW